MYFDRAWESRFEYSISITAALARGKADKGAVYGSARENGVK